MYLSHPADQDAIRSCCCSAVSHSIPHQVAARPYHFGNYGFADGDRAESFTSLAAMERIPARSRQIELSGPGITIGIDRGLWKGEAVCGGSITGRTVQLPK